MCNCSWVDVQYIPYPELIENLKWKMDKEKKEAQKQNQAFGKK